MLLLNLSLLYYIQIWFRSDKMKKCVICGREYKSGITELWNFIFEVRLYIIFMDLNTSIIISIVNM